MPFGRGFATALILILIALACIAIARRLEKERRFIGKLCTLKAFDPSNAVRLDQLTPDELATVADLTSAGVLHGRGNIRYLEQSAFAAFRRKRIRLTLLGAVTALAVAGLMVLLILRY